MIIIKRLGLFTSIIFLSLHFCYAMGQGMVPANKLIQNLPKTIAKLQKQTSVPVLFPKQIPKNPQYKNYYATGKITNSGYVIYVDSTKDCNGVHACNIGSITAAIGGNPQIYYDMQNKELTVPVKLKNNIKAYYTPGHAMGDYWPTMIVWRDKNVLYTIVWQINPNIERQAIVAMANSVYNNHSL